MTVHFSDQTRALDNSVMILNDSSSSLSNLRAAMQKLNDTGAIAPFNADPEVEKGNPVGEIAPWVYQMLDARVAAKGSKPNGDSVFPPASSR